MLKPLIVRGELLVAGHQRTKALRRLGKTSAAVFLLGEETTTYDEIRFNQLHNGTDLDSGDEECHISTPLTLGYQVIQPAFIKGNMRSRMAVVRSEVARLISRYGPWGGCVATSDGEVIHAAQYALAAKMTNTPLTVYAIEASRKEEYLKFLNHSYGEFSYKNIERKTYIQTFAQMFRLRNSGNERGRSLKSTLYEECVIPWIKKNPKARGIDFGAGQGDYVKKLKKEGVDIIDVELFRRKGNAINLAEVRRLIDAMNQQLLLKGKFDFVVCDSVLNSVDSAEAQQSVMTWLNYLCKEGGTVFFSGRSRERCEKMLNTSKHVNKGRAIEFLDKEGNSALYRKGAWFFQKFHSIAQVKQLAEDYQLKIFAHKHDHHQTSWQCSCLKQAEMQVEQVIAAANFEFNQPVSPNKTIDRHNQVIDTIHQLEARR
jgi:ParB family chromosome partitioning protein